MRKPTLSLLLVAVACTVVGVSHAWDRKLREPKVLTPLTSVELVRALRAGHQQFFGTAPSRDRLAMGWAQVAFENGHGALTYDDNLGNIGPTGPGQTYYYNPPDGHFYRSFTTPEAGAAAYWGVINRCKAAMQRFDAGQPGEAATYLKRCGYFEADVNVYRNALTQLFYEGLKKALPEEERERHGNDQ